MNKLVSLIGLLMVTSILMLSGCGTIHGAGHDIEAVGEAVQDAVDDNDD